MREGNAEKRGCRKVKKKVKKQVRSAAGRPRSLDTGYSSRSLSLSVPLT
jgi:hypothetical protein